MIAIAILDIIIGVLFLIGWHVWLTALLGSIHILIILTVTNITDITVRDIGILAGTVAIMTDSFSSFNFRNKIFIKG